MREQFGVLALGQCGGNIGALLEKLGYSTVYLNTSQEDLATINGAHKIHIPGSEGAAKDRKRVLQLASDSIVEIVGRITTILSQRYIMVVFSTGGGTGSGLSIPLLSYLSQVGKICIPVVVLPNEDKESAKSCENAYNTMAELMSIQGLGATFLLDNQKDDKFNINNKFVKDVDTFINLQNTSTYGNIDKAERKQILSCPGVSVITRVSKPRSNEIDIVQGLHNGVYAEIESKTAYYLGVSTSNKSLDTNSILKEFNGVFDVFSGVSEATTTVILAGLQFPQKRLLRFKDKFEKVVKNINMDIFNNQLPPLQTLSFTKPCIQPSHDVSPRDILLGLLNN